LKACAECLLHFSAALAEAGCHVPPDGKDLRHWCNNQDPPPAPTPPTPPPPPIPPTPPTPAGRLPCSGGVPCLFNIRDDPQEMHDLAASMPAVVEQMMARLVHYAAREVTSPFPGGHDWPGACSALNRTGGMWGPWLP
jgi:hypothetical protein